MVFVDNVPDLEFRDAAHSGNRTSTPEPSSPPYTPEPSSPPYKIPPHEVMDSPGKLPGHCPFLSPKEAYECGMKMPKESWKGKVLQ